MDSWRRIRAMLTIAVAWAIPWAVVGGALFLSYGVLSAPDNVPFLKYATGGWRFFKAGAMFAGALGAIAGGTFAALLSARARAHDLSLLSTTDASRLGAIGGAASVVPFMVIMAVASPRSPFLLTPLALFGSAAGALSAYAMLALARRRSSAETPLVESVESPSELRAAESELEQMLSARHNLTAVGADGRATEAAAGPPPTMRA